MHSFLKVEYKDKRSSFWFNCRVIHKILRQSTQRTTYKREFSFLIFYLGVISFSSIYIKISFVFSKCISFIVQQHHIINIWSPS